MNAEELNKTHTDTGLKKKLITNRLLTDRILVLKKVMRYFDRCLN